MTITDLMQLLKEAVLGNEIDAHVAQQKLLVAFKDNHVSQEQAEEIHLYLKAMSIK